MKHLIITTALATLPFMAHADGPSAPRYDPPVIKPAPSWNRPYVGISLNGSTRTEQRSTVTTNTEIPETETPVTDVCKFQSDHGPNGNGAKCWFPSEAVEVEFGELPRCHGNYSRTCIIATNGNGETRVFVFGDYRKGDDYVFNTGQTTITYGEPITTRIIDYFEQDFDETGMGLFAGVGHDAGSYVVRAEVATQNGLHMLEGHYGIPFDQSLGYGSLGAATDGDASGWVAGVGIDWMVTDNVLMGFEAYRANLDGVTVDGAALRVGVVF